MKGRGSNAVWNFPENFMMILLFVIWKNVLVTNLFGKVLTLYVSFVWPLLDLLNLSQNLWQDVMQRDWRISHGVLSYRSAFKNLFNENEKHHLMPYKGPKCRTERSAACETRLTCTLSENLIPSRIHRIRQHRFKGNSKERWDVKDFLEDCWHWQWC